MKNTSNYITVGLLVLAIAAVMLLKGGGKCPFACSVENAPASPAAAVQETTQTAIPKLIDLGADKCVPCKMMAPILEEIKAQYAGRLDVVFYDVWKNPDIAKQYGVSIIPTQIFFDAAGNELFRHEGFFSKEEIIGKYKELGIDLESQSAKD